MAVGQNKEMQNSPGRTSRGFWVSYEHMWTSTHFNTLGGKLKYCFTWNSCAINLFLFSPCELTFPSQVDCLLRALNLDFEFLVTIQMPFCLSLVLFQSCLLFLQHRVLLQATCHSLSLTVFTTSSAGFLSLSSHSPFLHYCLECSLHFRSWEHGFD